MTARIGLVGDIMLGDHPVCFGHGVRSSTRERGVSELFGPCREMLLNHDLVIGNLECVLSDRGMIPGNLQSCEMRGRPEDAHALAAANIRVVTVANNHTMQHGRAAFDDMVRSLLDAGISVTGLVSSKAASNVVELEVGDVRCAILGLSLRPEKHSDQASIGYAQGDIEGVRSQARELSGHYDRVILCLHWGEEYMHRPGPAQFDIARTLFDSGIDIIAGHHPHVVQGLEQVDDGVVLYSLGNFVFDKWRGFERETILATLNLERDSKSTTIEIEPMLIGHDFRVYPLDGTAREKRLQAWMELCNRLEHDRRADAAVYNKTAQKAYLRYRMESYLYFARHLHKYPPSVIRSSLARFMRRRLGMA